MFVLYLFQCLSCFKNLLIPKLVKLFLFLHSRSTCLHCLYKLSIITYYFYSTYNYFLLVKISSFFNSLILFLAYSADPKSMFYWHVFSYYTRSSIIWPILSAYCQRLIDCDCDIDSFIIFYLVLWPSTDLFR